MFIEEKYLNKGTKPQISVVSGGESFRDIETRLLTEIIRLIDDFHLSEDQRGANPKMAMSLIRALTEGVEQYLRPQTTSYIMARLDEQVERYIELGFHAAAGYSETDFRSALTPLITRVMDFFAPPSRHPIRDGEFTLLLVIPTQWVPMRRQLYSFLGDVSSGADALRTEIRPQGRPSPVDPYVLVGINGGRELKGKTIQQADEWVERHGRTFLSLHQLVQLFLVRPNFLSARTDTLLPQADALVLGEKCPVGLIQFSAHPSGINMVFYDEKKYLNSGVGVGKPYFTTLIS